ncbi:serine/threonine protein kinase [Archangium violaceum]|uniref:serine/threonine protein kinase n=1 Tax=Archangium violaceum TaxID=83451 RepID=UPI0006968112|nr:serine/threonine-protein kinase [Archangium violaceum]
MRKPLHPNQLRARQRIRDFRVVRRLGVGGFAFVFLLERGGHLYSCKMAVRPASPDDEDQVDAWMRREVSSLELLEHPGLLPVLEWGRWPDAETGYVYFVTPYVPGCTFHVWRWRQHASLHRTIEVLCEALKPLEFMHERGLCHRDLKADNLLVRDGDDKPFLIDLGAVHLPFASTLTDGVAPGTLYCQPPEVMAFLVEEAHRKGSRMKAHPSADLYMLGVLLYEILTGCHPFGPRLPLEKLLVAIASGPPDPRELVPEAPASLCDLTMRLLARAPERRPASVRAVREELERLREEEGNTAAWQVAPSLPERERIRERFPGVDVVEIGDGELVEPAPPPSPQAGPSRRAGWGRGWARGLAGVVLGAALLGLGWMLFHAEPGVPDCPAPSEKGTHPVSSVSHDDTRAVCPSPQVPSRLCVLLTSVVSASVAQLAGCATAPVRPDPVGYLDRCPAEARATPVKLGIDPGEHPTFIETGLAPASNDPEHPTRNVKPGPISATMFVDVNGVEQDYQVSGEAMTTFKRVYIQLDTLHLPDGSTLPICGVATDGLHQYGIPTWNFIPFEGARVDPDRVDTSPGAVIINDPRFETVLQGPEGYRVPRIVLAPPEYR